MRCQKIRLAVRSAATRWSRVRDASKNRIGMLDVRPCTQVSRATRLRQSVRVVDEHDEWLLHGYGVKEIADRVENPREHLA